MIREIGMQTVLSVHDCNIDVECGQGKTFSSGRYDATG